MVTGKGCYQVVLLFFLVLSPLLCAADLYAMKSSINPDAATAALVVGLLLQPISAVGLWRDKTWGVILLLIAATVCLFTESGTAIGPFIVLALTGIRFVVSRRYSTGLEAEDEDSTNGETMCSQTIKDIFAVLVPQQRWALVLWLLVAIGLLYVNTVGVPKTAVVDRMVPVVVNLRLSGWPFIHSTREQYGGLWSAYSPYLFVVDIVVCGLLLVSTGDFLDRYVHRWIKHRQWTMEDMVLMIIATALCFSLVLLTWDSPIVRFGYLLGRGDVNNLRDLPVYVMLPVMLGIFCLGHAICAFGYRLLQGGLRSGRHSEQDVGREE